MRDPLNQSETIPVKAFVTYDVAGYFVKFDWFPEHEKNAKLLSLLNKNGLEKKSNEKSD